MKNRFSFFFVLLCSFFIFGNANDVVELDTIEVDAMKFKEKDKAFTKSGAVSIRDELNKTDKDIDSIIRSIPGAFTQMDKGSGVLSVNIRGGSGFGRANTMIDGVTQTFFSSGGDTGSRGGATSQFGATVDTSFLTSVELDRGSFSGASGVNSLMGSANFRTIGVSDVLRNDQNYGAMIKGLKGTNDLGYEYMGAIAARNGFEYGGNIGFLYGYSYKYQGQNYQIGGGQTHKDISDELLERAKRAAREYCGSNDLECIEAEMRKYDISPYDPEKVKQKPQSHLFKVEYDDDYNSLNLQYRKMDNHLAGRSINTQTKQINYGFSIPDSSFINLDFLYSKNEYEQNYDKGTTIINRKVVDKLIGTNKADIFDIGNTFDFSLPFESSLKSKIGFNKITNEYSRNRYPDELRIFKICDEDEDDDLGCLTPTDEFLGGKFTDEEKINASLPTNSFFPQGKQVFKTKYVDNKLEWNIFALDFNFNIVKWKNKGQRLRIGQDMESRYDKIDEEIDDLKDELNLLNENDPDELEMIKDIKIQIADLERYQKDLKDNYYNPATDTWRRPMISDWREVSGNFINRSYMLSAYFSDYFSPFVGYSKTHRVPNIKEMYFSSLQDAGQNLDLRPETAKNYQIGFNGFIEGVILPKDKLGYKITRYKTDIDDFIYNVLRYEQIKDIKHTDGSFQTVNVIKHINSDERVNIRGFEIEVNYDMGKFFLNLAYSKQRTNQPSSYSDISRDAKTPTSQQAEAQSFGLTKVTILPNKYGSLEVGARFFNERLTLGAVAKYYGKSKVSKYETILQCEGAAPIWKEPWGNRKGYWQCPRIPGTGKQYPQKGRVAEYEEIKSQPFIYDIYAIYQPSENLHIKFALDNVFDKRYINPLDANNDSISNYIVGIQGSGGTYDDVEHTPNNYARGRTAKISFSYKF